MKLLRFLAALLPLSVLASTTPINNPVMSGFALFNGNAGSPAPFTNTLFQLTQANGLANIVLQDAFAGANVIDFRRADGTFQSPSPIGSPDNIGRINAVGYTTGGYSPLASGSIIFEATQAWSTGNQGLQVVIATTPNGSTTLTNAAIFGQDQSLTENGSVNVQLNASSFLGLQGQAGQVLGEWAATDSIHGRLYIDGFGTNDALNFRRANGTNASPLALTTGSTMGALAWTGYDGNGYAISSPAFIAGNASENWNSTSHGAYISFSTTANGTTTQPETMRLWGSGGLSLGNVSVLLGTDPGAGGLLMGGVLTVNDSGGTPAASPAGTIFEMAGTPAANVRMNMDAYGGIATYDMRRADGTVGSPTAIQSGETIGVMGFLGYGTTGYSSTRAAILGEASQTWTDANQGTQIVFNTTPNGSTTQAAVLTLGNDASAVFAGALSGITSLTASGNITSTSGNLITTSGNLSISGTGVFGSTIATAGGSAFSITAVNSVSPTSPNRTITINYGGTIYYLAAKTTDN